MACKRKALEASESKRCYLIGMLTLGLPVGNAHGWGVCGTNLAREFARRGPVWLVTPRLDLEYVGDELDLYALESVHLGAEGVEASREEIRSSPVLQAVTDHTLMPFIPELKGSRNVGYTFFEVDELRAEWIENARRHFDLIVGGSSWCADILKKHGLESATVVQGVDRSVFNAYENEKTCLSDRFVVFSGGKLELRKGQDLVIRAFAVLQERHDDVLLLNAWFNQWDYSRASMAASPHIDFVYEGPDHLSAINGLLAANGVDPANAITLAPKPNSAMARIYKNSDCGIFPNRCEGGTNLALMEYMACGKPVIASGWSGHSDVVSRDNALVLAPARSVDVMHADGIPTRWQEPAIDELVEALEQAYQDRDRLRRLGAAAGESMKRFSWAAAVDRFEQIVRSG